MSETRPNILLITTDQHRADCLGIAGHPTLQTPQLDYLGRSGSQFRRAYAECPSCIAARRTIMTGMAPAAHGMVGFERRVEWQPEYTLAGELSNAGYQTEMIGKLHLAPLRKRFGFDHMQLSDSSRGDLGEPNDYVTWLYEQGRREAFPGVGHGITNNGWIGRPHYLPEELTHTFWCVDRAIRFLQNRDPSAPFFLNVSFIEPHPPLTPPTIYYDRYIHRDLPKPVVGDWAEKFDGPQRGLNPDAYRIHLDDQQMQCCRAAYYGMINFIDDQIGRLLACGKGMENTFVLFTSDHGEMLGDHNLFRKALSYEASARVPFLIRPPKSMNLLGGQVIDAPVGLQDVMPTLLEAAGLEIPSTCTGQSLLPMLRGEKTPWREVLHGEHAGVREREGSHYLADARTKYIWHAITGREQLFDLANDPDELHDLSLQPDGEQRLAPWRQRLIEVLKDRPEGFVDPVEQKLVAGRDYVPLIPGYRPELRYPFL